MNTARNINPNMVLWEQVQETDTRYTKTAKLHGQDMTTINGTYIGMRATEIFGPVGKGWGTKILTERFDKGAPIVINGEVVAHDTVHTIYLELWYRLDGTINHVRQYGHTPFIYKTEWGVKTDFEYGKKTLTDAIKKCLVALGFSADIHLGLFDDINYVEGLKLKERLAEAGDPENALDEAKAEFKDWLSRQLSALERAPTVQSLQLICKQLVVSARAKASIVNFNPDEIEQRVRDAAAAREQHLTNHPPTNVLASEELGEAKE